MAVARQLKSRGQAPFMDIKDILLLIRPGEDAAASTAAAAVLAKAHEAQANAVYLTPLPSMHQADCYAVGADAVREVIGRMDREAEALAAAAEGPVRAALEAAGRPVCWNHTPAGESWAETALRARLSDLVVMTRPDIADSGARQLAEAMIRLGGAPCLLVPKTASVHRFDRIVLAWNGSRQAKRAMEDAMPLLRAASVVDVAVVGDADRIHSDDSLVEHLHRHGVTAGVIALSRAHGDCAAPLMDWCQGHDADLMVMGAFGRTPQAEHWFGGVTWTILTNAAVPVFMSC
jgi:nucleotide-binding universal stress UspA family protein